MPRKPKLNGAILYEGPSAIDGAPIVVIATGIAKATSNSKTGAMVQTWVMRTDIAPHHAIKTGADRSVCGDCRLRPTNRQLRAKDEKPCYVRTWQAPRSVHESYHRGIYPRVTPDEASSLLAGKKVRLGSYGNPSAAPLNIWRTATCKAVGRTGYIHNWRSAPPEWSELVMASVESVAEGIEARKLGYRLFRVTKSDDKQKGEVACPASKESGFKTTCSACLACGGTSAKAKADIVIRFH